MRRLASFGFAGFLVAAVGLPCQPGVPFHHETTRSLVTMADGETAETEVHNHFNKETYWTTFAIIDGRRNTLAGTLTANKVTDDYSIEFQTRPKNPVLLKLSYNLAAVKAGKPTALLVEVKGRKFSTMIDSRDSRREQREELAAMKRAVGTLPADFLESLRLAYAMSNASLSQMPTLGIIYYVLGGLAEGLSGAEVSLNEAQVTAFKAQFAEAHSEGGERPPKAKDIPEP